MSLWCTSREMTRYKKTIELEDGTILFQCSKCKEFKSRENFDKATTLKNWIQPSCKICRRKFRVNNKDKINTRAREIYASKNQSNFIKRCSEYRRERVRENWFWRERFHQNVRWYIKNAWLVFENCFSCGKNIKVEFHHPSYKSRDMRSVIVPLCRDCHRWVHSGRLECPEPIDLVKIAPWFKKS